MRRLALAALILAWGCRKTGSTTVPTLKVAAAADLALAFKDIGDAFEKKTGSKTVFSFGSTGLLAKQIIEGAPFDVFAAANISFVDDVVRGSACDPNTKALYARGRIVVWTRKDSAIPKPHSLAELADPRYAKIAIANPDHAPYGRAAQQAMTKAGIWDKVKARLVFGENVQQTLQFAQTGNAEVAIVALSLAVVSDGQYFQINPDDYLPLDQALVVCNHGSAVPGAASQFTAFVNSTDGRAIMRRYGFLLPGEALASAPK